jgi:ATP-dependent protease ClpP protease subunit
MDKTQKKCWIVSKVDSNTAELLLYGFINDEQVDAAEFVKELRNLESQYKTVNVRINSGGGDVFDGITMYNALKNSKAIINTYVDGLAGSMASIVMQAPKGNGKRYISKAGSVMTHKPSSGTYGSGDDLRNNALMLDNMEDVFCVIYSNATGKTKDVCKSLFMNGKDAWFTAQQAIDNGLADEMYDAEPVTLPTAAKEKDVWNIYNTQRFAASFNKSKNETMYKTTLPAAAIAALQIGDHNDQASFDAAFSQKITDLVAKANAHDNMRVERDNAVNKITALEAKTKDDEVIAMLATAMNDDKKINKATHDALAQQYKGKPDLLKIVLETLPKFMSVVKTTEGEPGRLEELMKMDWNKLDVGKGLLAELKALDFEGFKRKYKAQFKKDYPGKA